MMNSLLFINACVRKESRTKMLADRLLSKLDNDYDEVCLDKLEFPTVNEDYLRKRDSLIANKDFNAPMFGLARQFAEAKTIVIAAPFWDLSFPAKLKQYLEIINVVGITFIYSDEGVPIGLCNAKKLCYVTTAGGDYVPFDFGYGYVKALAQGYYGINEVELIQAKGLDIYGADVNEILGNVEKDILRMEG